MKFYIFLILITSVFQSISQVSITKPTGDLLIENYLGYSYERYLNKKFFVVPQGSESGQKGYENFLVSPTNLPTEYTGDSEPTYQDIEALRSRVFKPNTNFWLPVITRHDALAEKELSLKNIIRKESTIFFEFKIDETNEIIYYKYNPEIKNMSVFGRDFPFVLVEYFEYLNKKYSGSEYVLRSCFKSLPNAKTGADVTVNSDKVWKVVNITLSQHQWGAFYELSATLESDNVRILYPLNYLTNEACAVSKETSNKWLNIFGKEDYYAIIRNYFREGWNQDMVKLSQGEPQEIKEEPPYVVWVYKRYQGMNEDFKAEYEITTMYFKNGLLSHWKK